MTTTASITHCWKSARRHRLADRLPNRLAGWLRVGACVCLLVLAALAAPQARADTPTEITQLALERTDEGVFLSAQLQFELPAVVEDALLKGLPMVFLAEAEIVRERWYWTDRRVASASRQMRLSYQPLTRRWRIQVGSSGGSGLGMALGQHFDTLGEAVSVIERISRWKIADAAEIEPDARHVVEFRFRLDLSQLPRPFQIGTVGQTDWRIVASRRQPLPATSP